MAGGRPPRRRTCEAGRRRRPQAGGGGGPGRRGRGPPRARGRGAAPPGAPRPGAGHLRSGGRRRLPRPTADRGHHPPGAPGPGPALGRVDPAWWPSTCSPSCSTPTTTACSTGTSSRPTSSSTRRSRWARPSSSTSASPAARRWPPPCATSRSAPSGTSRRRWPASSPVPSTAAPTSTRPASCSSTAWPGRRPFAGADVGEVLQQHLSTPAPRLRALGVDVPQALDAVIQRLLRKDPAERYQSAAAAVADLTAIADGLRRGVREPAVVVGLHDRRQALTEPSFVGPHRRAGRPDPPACGGPPRAGAGSSCWRPSRAAARPGCSTSWPSSRSPTPGSSGARGWSRPPSVRSRCSRAWSRASSTPAGNGPGWPSACGRRWATGPRRWWPPCPPSAAVLGGEGGANLGPEAYGETRSIEALGALLDALLGGRPARPRPAVVLLDDCQWADGPTLELLGRLAGGRRPGTRRAAPGVLVVAAFRSEEVPRRPPAAGASTRWPPSPCPRSEAASVAQPGRVDGRPAPRGRPAHGRRACPRAARSWPRPSCGGWSRAAPSSTTDGRVGGRRRARWPTCRRPARRRLPRPPPRAAGPGDAASCCRWAPSWARSSTSHLATELCRQDPAEAAAGLAEARRRRIVWVDEAGGRARFLHDKLREALLGRLDADRAPPPPPAGRRAHRGRSTPDRVFELAYHFDAAGDGQRALPYALRAAERARAQHSLDVAAAHYRIALAACTEPGQDGDPGRGGRGPGRRAHPPGLLRGGHRPPGGGHGPGRRPTSPGPSSSGKLGDVAFKPGRPAPGPRAPRAGRPPARPAAPPPVPRPRRWPCSCEVVVQVAHTLLPRLFLARRPPGGRRARVPRHPPLQPPGLRLLVQRGQGPLRLGPPAGDEPGRALPAVARAGPGLLRARAGDDDGPLVRPGDRLRPAVARHPPRPRRPLGPGPVAQLLRRGPLRRLPLPGVASSSAGRRSASSTGRATGGRPNTATWHVAFAHYRLGELAEAPGGGRRPLRRRQRHRRRHRGRGRA